MPTPGAIFIPSTPAPTHPGRFRAGPGLGIGGNRGGPFLPDLFGGAGRQLIEVAFGYDRTTPSSSWVWTDITEYVQWHDMAEVTIGSPDETTGTVPASFGVTLLNNQPFGGDFSLENALGAFWPDVVENAPVRAQLDVGQGPSLRFQGYATSWEPRRGPGGVRMVRLAAHGISRQLRQGEPEKRSAIRRFFDCQPAYDRPVRYWSLEDESGATSAADTSGADAAPAMLVQGGSSGGAGVRFGVPQGRVQPPSTGYEVARLGLKSMTSLGQGGILSSILPGTTGPRYAVHLIGAQWTAGADIVLARWFTPGGTFVRYEIISYDASGFTELVGYTTGAGGSGTTLGSTDPDSAIDEWEIVAYQVQNGANLETYFYMITGQVGGQAGLAVTFDSRAGTVAAPRHIFLNATGAVVPATSISASGNLINDIRVGHLAVWHTTPQFITTFTSSSLNGVAGSPWNGWIGESATDRMARLCAEDGVEIDIIGESDIAMGFQDVGDLLGLLEECAEADGGLLLDGLGAGFTYIARTELYSRPAALTLDVNGGGDVIGDVQGRHDDLRRVNSYTARNPGGGERSFTQPDGALGTRKVGKYGDRGDHSTYIDDDLYQIAAFKVGQGTVPGVRYPGMSVDFAKPGTSTKAPAWLTSLPFSRIDADGIESGTSKPDRSFVLRAWRERWNSRTWPVDFTFGPYDAYAVSVLADTLSPGGGEFLGWLDCDPLTTVAELAAGGTSVTVEVGTGTTLTYPSVSTYADDIDGLYVNLDGMKVGVTAISAPSGTRQTLTVVGADVLRRVLPGAPVSAWQPFILGL